MEQYRDIATTLVARGYWTLPVNGKKPVDTGWNERRDDEMIVAKRVGNGVGKMNTGIICCSGDEGGVVGIDIDVTDKLLSHRIYDSVVSEFELLGELPLRIGRNPKCLVVVGCTDVFKKKKLEFTDRNGEHHAIEILGSGQQFVSYGEHPDTGKPYRWIGPGIADVEVSDLAQVNEAMIDDWLDVVEKLLVSDGCQTARKDSYPVSVAPTGNDSIDDSDGNVERIREWLASDASVSIEGSGGDDTCYRVACLVKDEGLSKAECFAAMRQVWNPRCTPPWSDADLKAKVKSAYKYGTKETGINVVRDVFTELDAVEGEGHGSPIAQYIYIAESEKYMHRATRQVRTGNALNTIHGSDIVGRQFVAEFRQHPGKTVVDKLGWFPEPKEIVTIDGVTYANTYRPPTLLPVEGDVSEWLALCHAIWGECVEHCLSHMAYTVQFPEKKITWQILTEGEPRTGKSMVTKPLQIIFAGSHSVVQNENISSGWGDVWASKKCVFAEEVYQPGNKQFFNSIKTKLANREVEVLNIKTQGLLFQLNVYSIYMCTNHLDGIHFNKNEDKLLVAHAPSQEEMLAEGWTENRYTALGEAIESGDMASRVYHWLLQRDLSDFRPGKMPLRTQAMDNVVAASRPDYQSALIEMLDDFGEAFLFTEVRDELRKQGYRFGDRGVADVLSEHGYIHCFGKRKFSGVQRAYRFWSNSKDVIEMNQTEKYDFWNSYKISRYQ